jgi:hypothetical protein
LRKPLIAKGFAYCETDFDKDELKIHQAKYAASAGIISHSKPLIRKNKKPATPKRFTIFAMNFSCCSGILFIK